MATTPVDRYIDLSAGRRKPLLLPVDSGTVIQNGDMVYLDTDDVKPLSALSDSGSEGQNQAAASQVFIGIARKGSQDGETRPIRVDTEGIFEFDCVSGTYEVGSLVGPNGTGSGEAVGVSNTEVVAVTSEHQAVGRVSKRAASATRVQVEIISSIMRKPAVATVLRRAETVTAETGTSVSLTAAKLIGGIVTSTQTSAVTATLDTGANMDAALPHFQTGDGFYWTLANFGSSSGAATVTASSGHTITTGSQVVVAITTSRRFYTRKTGAATWVTICVG